jgi:hypothetical protein
VLQQVPPPLLLPAQLHAAVLVAPAHLHAVSAQLLWACWQFGWLLACVEAVLDAAAAKCQSQDYSSSKISSSGTSHVNELDSNGI